MRVIQQQDRWQDGSYVDGIIASSSIAHLFELYQPGSELPDQALRHVLAHARMKDLGEVAFRDTRPPSSSHEAERLIRA